VTPSTQPPSPLGDAGAVPLSSGDWRVAGVDPVRLAEAVTSSAGILSQAAAWGPEAPVAEVAEWLSRQPDSVHWVPFHQTFSDNTTLGSIFANESPLFFAYRADLHRMVEMGLGHLPIEAAAVPATTPPLHARAVYQMASQGVSAAPPRPVRSFSGRLTEVFPVSFCAALYELQSIFKKLDVNAYLIGGLPRDLCRLVPGEKLAVHDVDLTLEADASVLAEYVVKASRNFTIAEVYPEFGTAKLIYKQSLNFDLASTRLETYARSGALPHVVARGVPLVQDILRRDFTMNTLVFSLNHLGDILDVAHGLEDMDRRLVRVLHGASFFEDPSRILRAFQFQARFSYALSPETLYLIQMYFKYCGQTDHRGGGARISAALKGFLKQPENRAKREAFDTFLGCQGVRLIHSEWQLDAEQATLLLERQVAWEKKLDKLRELFVRGLKDMDPEAQEDVLSNRTRQIFFNELRGGEAPSGSRPRSPAPFQAGPQTLPIATGELLYLAYLCLLFEIVADPQRVWSRLDLGRSERDLILAYRGKQFEGLFARNVGEVSPYRAYQLFTPLPSTSCWALVFLSQHFQNALKWYQFYLHSLKGVRLALNGNDLKHLGVPLGEQIGNVLQQLLARKLEGRLRSREDEVQYVQQWLAWWRVHGDAMKEQRVEDTGFPTFEEVSDQAPG
jgi:hypothetical protein